MNERRLIVRCCEIVVPLKDDSGNTILDIKNMEKVLKDSRIVNYCYIIHDKDTYSAEEEQVCPEHKEGDLKPVHIHLLLKLNLPQYSEIVARWFQISKIFVSRIHNGWKNAVIYQLHRNAPEKYQYSIEEITANFDVQSMIDSVNQQIYVEENLTKFIKKEELKNFHER